MDIKHTFKVKVSPNRSGGFSLIELLVVLGMLVLITTVTLVSHFSFNSSIVLSSLAYDIALSIRQAQVFGLAVREYKDEFSAIPNPTFDTGYGVHFDSSTPKSYILFADTDRQLDYDGVTERDEVFTIGRGNFISEFCATNSVPIEKCSSTGVITYLDIIFDRPDPEAIIKTNLGETYGSARIVISSPRGNERVIRIFSTGQISVESP